MTQDELASTSGMSRRWVQELESGKLVPSLEAALNVANAFGYEMHLDAAPDADQLNSLLGSLS